MFFQASGQGYVPPRNRSPNIRAPPPENVRSHARYHPSPYYGQCAWYTFFNPEKIPSAIERYQKEIHRVLGVLESVLSKQQWLVGGRPSAADISFITCVSLSLPRPMRFAVKLGDTGGTTLRRVTSLKTSTASILRRTSRPCTGVFAHILVVVSQLSLSSDTGGTTRYWLGPV